MAGTRAKACASETAPADGASNRAATAEGPGSPGHGSACPSGACYCATALRRYGATALRRYGATALRRYESVTTEVECATCSTDRPESSIRVSAPCGRAGVDITDSLSTIQPITPTRPRHFRLPEVPGRLGLSPDWYADETLRTSQRLHFQRPNERSRQSRLASQVPKISAQWTFSP
jgi:hypothetical protein